MENQEKKEDMRAEIITYGYQSRKKHHRAIKKYLALVNKRYGLISEQLYSKEVDERPPGYKQEWHGDHELSRAPFEKGKDAHIDEVYHRLVDMHQKAKEKAEEEKKHQQELQQELQTAFDKMSKKLKEAIVKTVHRLNDNGDYTKYSFHEIAFVLVHYLGICEIIEWSKDYNSRPNICPPIEVSPPWISESNRRRAVREHWPVIAQALYDNNSQNQEENENRVFTFFQNGEKVGRIKLPSQLDCDKYFYEFTIYDFIGTEVEFYRP